MKGGANAPQLQAVADGHPAEKPTTIGWIGALRNAGATVRNQHASPAFRGAPGGQPRPRQGHWAWADARHTWPTGDVNQIENSVTTGLLQSLRNAAATCQLTAYQTRRVRAIGLGWEAHLEALTNQSALSNGVRPADSATDAQLEPHASPGDCDRR